jgi:hypothetical protein
MTFTTSLTLAVKSPSFIFLSAMLIHDEIGGGRGICCVAPERFYDSGGEVEKLKQTLTADLWKKDGPITEAMDVFSAG